MDETCRFIPSRTEVGVVNFFPKSIVIPSITKKIPPTVKITLWYLVNACAKKDAPNPIGRNTVRTPKKKTKVIKKILYFSLKILPKYDGSRTVIQHGEKSAPPPATNAAINDVPTNVSIYFFACSY